MTPSDREALKKGIEIVIASGRKTYADFVDIMGGEDCPMMRDKYFHYVSYMATTSMNLHSTKNGFIPNIPEIRRELIKRGVFKDEPKSDTD